MTRSRQSEIDNEFMRIYDELRAEHPEWDQDQFDRAIAERMPTDMLEDDQQGNNEPFWQKARLTELARRKENQWWS